MFEINRIAIFGKLNPLAYKALENAALLCKLRGNPRVELSHFVYELLQLPASDLKSIILHCRLDAARLASDLNAALDRLPRSSSSITELSSQLEESVEHARMYGRLMFRQSQVRSGHMLIAWLETPFLQQVLSGISSELSKLDPQQLSLNFHKLTARSPEALMRAYDGSQPIAATSAEFSYQLH